MDPNSSVIKRLWGRNFVFLSSLLKVHLQLRGFSVFLDIDRLRAGKFDENLLMNIKLAKHFLLVLTSNALDRCIGDSDRQDWVHKVIKSWCFQMTVNSHYLKLQGT